MTEEVDPNYEGEGQNQNDVQNEEFHQEQSASSDITLELFDKINLLKQQAKQEQ